MVTSFGRLSQGPSSRLLERTLQFIEEQLSLWRDDTDRHSAVSEEELNAQLCKFLTVKARQEFPMVFFHHEEKQTGRRRVDLSALPTKKIIVDTTYYSIYDPFLVIEGKRLPAPSADREREYVTGGDTRSGGIQRFKLGLHGAELETAAMIGYLQNGEFQIWHNSINLWIEELVEHPASADENWSILDQLNDLHVASHLGVARSYSVNFRMRGRTDRIRIVHLWIKMHHSET